MRHTLTRQEKETILLYNQDPDPIIISTYDPDLRKRLTKYANQHPDICKKLPTSNKDADYAQFQIEKDRVTIRLLPPPSEKQRNKAREQIQKNGKQNNP